jgi:hypothetical protein
MWEAEFLEEGWLMVLAMKSQLAIVLPMLCEMELP